MVDKKPYSNIQWNLGIKDTLGSVQNQSMCPLLRGCPLSEGCTY